jgi:hypothetical protein
MNFYQGVIVHGRSTRAITEAMAAFLITTGSVLAAGMWFGRATGLNVAAAAFTLGGVVHLGWLRWRAREPFRAIVTADQATGGALAAY